MIETCMAQMRGKMEADREGSASKSHGRRLSFNKQDMAPVLEVFAEEFEQRMAHKDEELAQLRAEMARTAVRRRACRLDVDMEGGVDYRVLPTTSVGSLDGGGVGLIPRIVRVRLALDA